MGVMSSFLNMFNCGAVAYPPIHCVFLICKNFCYCRCPTAAAENAELHFANIHYTN